MRLSLLAATTCLLQLSCAPPVALLSAALTPGEPFGRSGPPSPPDYSRPEFWAALPDREDSADLVPADSEAADQQDQAPVDVFFVHPTTFYSRSGWNQPLDDTRANNFTDLAVMAGQASAFNGCCKIYAPRYRQATLASYIVDQERSEGAFHIAYRDVAAAFRYYMAHHNDGRPFILASHSQGTMHAIRLLEEIEDGPASERMIAAYLIGYRLPVDKFERSYRKYPVCRSAEQTGCVIAWDTFAESAADRPHRAARHWYGEVLELAEARGAAREPLCVNPISWRPDEELAPASAHRGAVAVNTGDQRDLLKRLLSDQELATGPASLAAPLIHYSGARCRGGRLFVPAPQEPAFKRQNMAGSLHTLDYSLFYMDIRANAQARVHAFLKRAAGRGEER